MAKINDRTGSGGTKPPSNEFTFESELFKDLNEDTGTTIGIVVAHGTNPKIDVDGKDSFDTDSKIDLGAGATPEKVSELDIKKLRRESDTGLTVQMNQILLKRNLKG